MIKVILKRGKKNDIVYEHADMRSAKRRTFALVDLHSAHIPDMTGDTIIVDASHYYDKTLRKDPE